MHIVNTFLPCHMVLSRFSLLCAKKQDDNNSAYVHEHPAGAASWNHRKVHELVALNPDNTEVITFDQCYFNLQHPGREGVFLQKKTKVLSNSAAILHPFRNAKCPGNHCHGRIQGSAFGKPISTWAARYPSDMVSALADGVAGHLGQV